MGRTPGAGWDATRHTDWLRVATNRACLEALRKGQAEAGPAHLLLGILRVEDVAERVLWNLGVDPDWVKAAVRAALPVGDFAIGRRVVDMVGAEARAVFRAAGEEAEDLGHSWVGTEHVLLALLREGGPGEEVRQQLSAWGVEYGKARAEVQALLTE